MAHAIVSRNQQDAVLYHELYVIRYEDLFVSVHLMQFPNNLDKVKQTNNTKTIWSTMCIEARQRWLIYINEELFGI